MADRPPPGRLPQAVAVLLLATLGASCGRQGSAVDAAPATGEVRGVAITTPARAGGTTNALPAAVAGAPPEVGEGGFLRLGFARLSGFKFDVHEVYSETNSGRPLLRSDDTIPPEIKALDGKQVSVRGFVLPLRLKRGKVIEFLLLRDQGSCCFGPQAQINHFIRVRHPAGAVFESGLPYRVAGVLRVGEVYVQGYLTGIYNFDAEQVSRAED